jgi:signal transduction histidine kinase
MAGKLWAPEIDARTYDGMVAVAQRAQAVVGFVALLALWLLQGVPARDKVVVTALLVTIYLPWVALTPRLARTAPRFVNLAVDLLAIAVFPLVIAETRIAVMVLFMLMVGYHAYASGRVVGLSVVAGVLAVVGAAEWLAPVESRLDAFTLVMYATALIAFTVMLDSLAAQRRSLVRHLSRLNEALDAVAADPDLDRTLNSVAIAARDAIAADFVVVLMVRDGRIDADSQVSTRDLSGVTTQDEIQRVLNAIVDETGATPSGLAIHHGATVAVTDVRSDKRFTAWHPVAAQLGIRSAISVPLMNSTGCLGVLAAYSGRVRAFSEDDIALVTAYSRQAALAVARALAFEQERSAALRSAEADRVKSEFVARVSHELRTPLTAINGFISTVLLHWDQLDDTSKKDLLGRAGRNTTDLRRLVEQVLAFSRTGEAPSELVARPLALAAEVDNLISHLAPVIGDHSIHLDVDPSIVVRVDREALHHVLTNLLSNAAKFSPDGSAIRVAAHRRGGGMVEVSVCDEGPGIAPAEQEKIFERFYRSSSVSARGTGIGLSIVDTFVARMGGRVWVESTPGDGATFVFTIPEGERAKRPAEAGSPRPELVS